MPKETQTGGRGRLRRLGIILIFLALTVALASRGRTTEGLQVSEEQQLQPCGFLEKYGSSRNEEECWELMLQPVVDGLNQPVGIANAGDGSGRLFVIEKKGTIQIVQKGRALPEPFLDISEKVNAVGNEQGLLGLAFHPDYANSGQFFVNYTDRQGNTVVSRFLVSNTNLNEADAANEMVIFTQAQSSIFHNGGHLAFGPDGYLYIGTGEDTLQI